MREDGIVICASDLQSKNILDPKDFTEEGLSKETSVSA